MILLNPIFFQLFRSLYLVINQGMNQKATDFVGLEYIKNHKATPPYSLSERVFLLIGYIFSFRSADSWNDLTDRINQCPNEQSKYVSIPSGRRHYFGETYRRESMLKAQNMKFEDRFFPVPSGYDEYFSKLYGDYMTIPPVEKREKHYVHSVAFK